MKNCRSIFNIAIALALLFTQISSASFADNDSCLHCPILRATNGATCISAEYVIEGLCGVMGGTCYDYRVVDTVPEVNDPEGSPLLRDIYACVAGSKCAAFPPENSFTGAECYCCNAAVDVGIVIGSKPINLAGRAFPVPSPRPSAIPSARPSPPSAPRYPR